MARTCRAFKEPALDVLWEELVDTSPLAKCLPEASHHSQISSLGNKRYSFSRSLTQIEWGILRSYTRRIRSIQDCNRELDWESVRTFLNPLTTEQLFPNLRYLYAGPSTEIKHLLYMPFPSLISLRVQFMDEENLYVLQGSLQSFFKFSPNIRKLSIHSSLGQPHITFSNFFSSWICRWQDLQTVVCGSIALDVDALAHLPRMPALTRLTCTLSATLPAFDSPLFFSNLHNLTLHSEFLDPISRLLSRTRLPAITDFTTFIDNRPSKQDFSSFEANVQASVVSHTIQELWFIQGPPPNGVDVAPRPVLGLEYLQPCMEFSNLRRINLNTEWNVDLTDSELLALASAWPHLEHLLINLDWGWHTLGGITPNGLLQLLQKCRALSRIALAIDTRGYTEFPQSPASLGLTLPPTFSIDVLDSIIEAESVPAIAAFFAGIAPRSKFSFHACMGWFMEETVSMVHWYDAYERANDALSQRY